MANCGPRPTHFGSLVPSTAATPEQVYTVPADRLAEIHSATITNLTTTPVKFSIYRTASGGAKDASTSEFRNVEIAPGETWVTSMKWVLAAGWELWVEEEFGSSINFSFDGSERDA